MIFDALDKARKYLPAEINKQINRARIFHFDAFPREMVIPDITDSLIDFANHDFSLPFPCVAVEDKVSCLVLWDFEKGACGLLPRRGFVEYLTLDMAHEQEIAYGMDEVHLKDDIQEAVKAMPKGSAAISWRSVAGGRLYRSDDGRVRWAMPPAEDVHATFLGYAHNTIVNVSKEIPDGDVAVLRNVKSAYDELMYISQPDRFVLERRPVQATPKNKKKCKAHIRASEDRPIYTLVRPNEARSIMKLPEPEPKCEGGRVILERRAHWRREHTRTLRSDRYKAAQGKTVTVPRSFVPAFWNGDRQAQVGKHVYRVLVD